MGCHFLLQTFTSGSPSRHRPPHPPSPGPGLGQRRLSALWILPWLTSPYCPCLSSFPHEDSFNFLSNSSLYHIQSILHGPPQDSSPLGGPTQLLLPPFISSLLNAHKHSLLGGGSGIHFLFGTVILGLLSIFKKSQASSPYEALNSVCLSRVQRM